MQKPLRQCGAGKAAHPNNKWYPIKGIRRIGCCESLCALHHHKSGCMGDHQQEKQEWDVWDGLRSDIDLQRSAVSKCRAAALLKSAQQAA